MIILVRRGGRHTAGGRGKLEQLLINMSAFSLSFFFLLSVEEEEEDEEMMEAKPGPESEQQDEDDNRENKEGTRTEGWWKCKNCGGQTSVNHFRNYVTNIPIS